MKFGKPPEYMNITDVYIFGTVIRETWQEWVEAQLRSDIKNFKYKENKKCNQKLK